jgi:hypothetical protein
VESEGVKVAIIHLENGRIELMQPTNDASPIKKFLEKKGQGLHHMALETEDIDGEKKRVKDYTIWHLRQRILMERFQEWRIAAFSFLVKSDQDQLAPKSRLFIQSHCMEF